MNLLIAGKISENNNLAEKLSSLGYNIISFPDERASVSSFSIDVADIDGVVCNGLFLYNDIKEFNDNPSAERIAMFIYKNLLKVLLKEGLDLSKSSKSGTYVSKIDVFETEKNRARYIP